MQLKPGIRFRRRRATIRNHLLVASLLAGALLIPVNEAVQAEIETREIFELSITENNLKTSKRWSTPAVQFPKVADVGCGASEDPEAPDQRREPADLNPFDLEDDKTTCFDYVLKISYPPDSNRPVRLRVGLNTRNAITGTQLTADDRWDVILFDPTGQRRGRENTNRSQDVTEVVASRVVDANPPLDSGRTVFTLDPTGADNGNWRVRVVAFQVNKLVPPESESPFVLLGSCTGDPKQQFCEPTFADLRAILEAEPDSPVAAKPLFPDLVAVPPYSMEFGCQAAGGAVLPDTPTVPPAAVCLRAAFGHGNVGDGPLELKVTPKKVGALEADVKQRVFRRDATPWNYRDNEEQGLFDDFDAGTASFHEPHGHWHYDNIWTARLFRVNPDFTLDPDPKKAVVSAKRGNCAHDSVLLRWKQTFFSEAKGTGDSGGDCSGFGTDSPDGIRIGLSRGWADAYTASLPDQYFDFTNEATSLDRLGNGTYLAQVQIDAPALDDEGGLIHELKEDNNFGYTLFEISNFDPVSAANPELARRTIKITILERGRGKSHLDPKKVPLFGTAE